MSVNIGRSVLKRPASNPLSVVSEISDTGNSFWLSGEINSDKSEEGKRAALGFSHWSIPSGLELSPAGC